MGKLTKIKYWCWVLSVIFWGWHCAGDQHNALDQAARTPLSPEPPTAATFSYLLYDNDFNAVPMDASPKRYVTTPLDSVQVGLVYALDKEQAFSPGLHAQLPNITVPTWYHISLKVLQYSDDVEPALQRGFVVVSIERGDSIVEYQPYSIDKWLSRYQRHVVDKWEQLEFWHRLPAVMAGDQIKIYLWNPEGGLLYLDDLKVEVWQVLPPYEQTHQKSHRLAELNYEGDGWGPQKTQEQAYRGIGSALLYKGVGGVPYGSGYEQPLSAANIAAGDLIQIQFAALKQHGLRQADRTALMVCALNRNGESMDWKGWVIDPRLWRAGQQTVNEWHQLTWWIEVPDDWRPNDVLQIYPWNDTEQRVFLDDLTIYVWKPQ